MHFSEENNVFSNQSKLFFTHLLTVFFVVVVVVAVLFEFSAWPPLNLHVPEVSKESDLSALRL